MRILGIESSAKAASVAVCEDGKLLSQYYQATALTHSKTLLAMCSDMLKNLDMKMNDVDLIAVAYGPGSFTGIRIGVAAAKGLAWGSDKKIVPVSTLEAMANTCYSNEYTICPVMDARRAQVYNALFQREGSGVTRLCADRAVSLDELSSDIKMLKKTCFLVGDGAELCYNYLKSAGVDPVLAPEPYRLQNAWGVCAAALGKSPLDAGDFVPNYIRLSQAERERLKRSDTSDK